MTAARYVWFTTFTCHRLPGYPSWITAPRRAEQPRKCLITGAEETLPPWRSLPALRIWWSTFPSTGWAPVGTLTRRQPPGGALRPGMSRPVARLVWISRMLPGTARAVKQFARRQGGQILNQAARDHSRTGSAGRLPIASLRPAQAYKRRSTPDRTQDGHCQPSGGLSAPRCW